METRTIEAYGIQREMLAGADVDRAGLPRFQPYSNISDLICIDGPLSVPRLIRALYLVADSLDVLRGRPYSDGGRWYYAFDEDRPALTHAVVEHEGSIDDFAGSGVCELFRRAVHGRRDLQRDSLLHAIIARAGKNRHLLLLTVDHIAADGIMMRLVVRRVLRMYGVLADRMADSVRYRFSGFFPYVESLARLPEEKNESANYWSDVLASSIDQESDSWFPHGVHKKGTMYDHTEACAVTLSSIEAEQAHRFARSSGITVQMLWLAVLSAATRLWNDRWLPIHHIRHGRQRTGSLNVGGPLMELLTSVPEDPADVTLAARLASVGRRNLEAPPLFGMSLRDLAETASDRVILFNPIPTGSSISIAGLEAGPAHALTHLLAESDMETTSWWGAVVRVWSAEKRQLTVHSDPRFLPDGYRLAHTMRAIVSLACSEPNIALREAEVRLRDQWEGCSTTTPGVEIIEPGVFA